MASLFSKLFSSSCPLDRKEVCEVVRGRVVNEMLATLKADDYTWEDVWCVF